MAFKGFAQKDEPFVEEKSSTWIKVVHDETAGRPKTSVKKKANSNPSRKESSQQEFDKTNSEVNRFKKPKKN